MTSSAILSIFVFLLSCLVALLLAIHPIPSPWLLLRPEVVCLVIIYWALYNPHQVSVGIAFLVGLLQDVVEDTVWGGHAMGLALVAYLCVMSYRRLRSYGISQQMVWVFVFVGIHQLFVNWVQSLDNYAGPADLMVVSALTSALCWPLVVLSMRRLRNRYRLF
jgi:rod shape-determining protein MreD